MTHSLERNFSDTVREKLVEAYGEDNVEENKYLDETGRFADFLVYTPMATLAIEVENDWEACIEGVGQALLYSAHYPNTVPMVVVPSGHTEEPEATILREHIPIVEIRDEEP